MRSSFFRSLQSAAATHRATTTIVLSLVAHVLVMLLLVWRRAPLPVATEVTLLSAPAPSPDEEGAPASAGAPAETAAVPAARSRSRAAHGHRARSPAPLAPAPAVSAEAAPVAPGPPTPTDDEQAIGDEQSVPDPAAPGDDRPGDGTGGVAGLGSGSGDGGSGRGGNGRGNGVDLSRAPDLDRESCVRGLDYPWKAALLDKEGVVLLRVALDATGHVRQVQVRRKAGYGFDEAATESVRRRCRFTAALDRHGKPTDYVIEDYRFYFIYAEFEKAHESASLH